MNTGDQTNAGGDQSYRVAITPTWETVAKISIEALLNGTTNGQAMAREEIIDLGIKLDDAKEILEGTNTETYKKQLNRINNQVRHIDQLERKVEGHKRWADEMEGKYKALKAGQEQGYANYQRQADKDLETIKKLEKKLEEKDQLMAMQRQQIENLEEARGVLQRLWDERNVQQPGLPGVKHEDPIHDKILDLILESEVGKRNKLTDEAMDLVGVRELMVYTINQQIKHNETYKEDPEYDAELAKYVGQDTSIDEQVANNQPHREGDE